MLHYTRIVIALFTLVCGIAVSSSVDRDGTGGVAAIAGYSTLEPARFEVRVRPGTLQLDGHTVSSEHKHQLLHAAGRSFSDLQVDTSFTRIGVAPQHWTTTTVSLLQSLSSTQSSHARLTNETLRIRGIATGNWHEQIEILRGVLPGSVKLDVDILVPDTKIRVADLCARAIATQEPGPVNFEESGTALRGSAYISLDRVIALADACRKTTVSITGHTDSSGHEAWNRELSLARAMAVADYIAGRGIARERIVATGAGSSLPVADNGTRYGRSLNRRINIVLHQGKTAGGS